MANIAFTEYVIEGTKRELEKLDHIFKTLMTIGRENDWQDRYELKRLIKFINPDFDGILDGDWDNYEFIDEPNKPKTIHFDTETAWRKNPWLEKAILQICPTAKIFYYEDTDEGFDSNDKKNKYFNTFAKIDYCLESDTNIESFKNEKSFLKRFNELMGTDCKTIKEANEYAYDYEDEDNEDYFINVYTNV